MARALLKMSLTAGALGLAVAALAQGGKPGGLTQSASRLGTCVNLGNHLEGRAEGQMGRALTDADFRDIAGVGFKTVRMPANFAAHQGPAPDFIIEPAFLDRVEHLVDVARRAGLRIIVDNHNFNALMTDPDANSAQLAAAWRQVAERLKRKDGQVWFEIINEPNGKLTNANLAATLSPALAEIRKTNPTRPVVIGGESWSGIDSLSTVPLLDDPNLVYTVHYYEPFAFTHQGATWVQPVRPMGTTFGSKADADQLAGNVAKAQAFMTRTGRPLFVGETGAFESIPLAQRAPYYKAIHTAFDAAGIDSCIWAYANTFPVRDAKTGEWHREILAALGL